MALRGAFRAVVGTGEAVMGLRHRVVAVPTVEARFSTAIQLRSATTCGASAAVTSHRATCASVRAPSALYPAATSTLFGTPPFLPLGPQDVGASRRTLWTAGGASMDRVSSGTSAPLSLGGVTRQDAATPGALTLSAQQTRSASAKQRRKMKKIMEKESPTRKAMMQKAAASQMGEMRMRREDLGVILDAYIPRKYREKQPKPSIMSVEGLRDWFGGYLKKVRSTISYVYILRFVSGFNAKTFAKEAQLQFVEVNLALAAGDAEGVRQRATLTCAHKLNALPKTPWDFFGEVAPPKCIHFAVVEATRTADADAKTAHFAQVTVRMVTTQSLRGGPEKECIDYVVFERNLEDKSVTQWHLAGKVQP